MLNFLTMGSDLAILWSVTKLRLIFQSPKEESTLDYVSGRFG